MVDKLGFQCVLLLHVCSSDKSLSLLHSNIKYSIDLDKDFC